MKNGNLEKKKRRNAKEFLPLSKITLEDPAITPSKHQTTMNIFDAVWNQSSKFGNLHFLRSENNSYSGRHLTYEGKPLINFGSCSYFGLENDSRLKQAAINAIHDYGVQYSSSQACVAINLYDTLQERYTKIFEIPTLVTASTTLGHLACIPVIIDDNDVIIYDQQVHNSVQMALKTITASNVIFEKIAHNNLDHLIKKIKTHHQNNKKIWFFLDGVYSMYGDFAPIEILTTLLEEYPNLHLYIDDAHGMSWIGKHGQGFALSKLIEKSLLDRVIIATSHSKCFGCAGGSLIIQNKATYNQVKRFGPTMIFSGPLQPPLLAANIASADIHLSDEIYLFQEKLNKKIQLRNSLYKKFQLPIAHDSQSPISFLGIGPSGITAQLCIWLRELGFYANPAIFPVVGLQKNGIRITTTLNQTDEDIVNFSKALKHILDQAIAKNLILEDTPFKIFKIPKTFTIPSVDL